MQVDRGPNKVPGFIKLGHVPAIQNSTFALTQNVPPLQAAVGVQFDPDFLPEAVNEAEKPPEPPRKPTSNPFLKRPK